MKGIDAQSKEKSMMHKKLSHSNALNPNKHLKHSKRKIQLKKATLIPNKKVTDDPLIWSNRSYPFFPVDRLANFTTSSPSITPTTTTSSSYSFYEFVAKHPFDLDKWLSKQTDIRMLNSQTKQLLYENLDCDSQNNLLPTARAILLTRIHIGDYLTEILLRRKLNATKEMN
ncbi:hypothetical protein SNEBB_000457 [Seison nebaliae]|nr:hypothetical protein SNEBB_000457 [Seison nebaliae]